MNATSEQFRVDSGQGVPATAAGGMSGQAAFGLASMLGGGLLSYLGERQGAKSMQREAERQAAEQEALSIQRHQRLSSELNRFDPQTQQALNTGGFLRSQQATAPALAAGGRALGLSGSAVASTGRGLLPAQRLQATQQGIGRGDGMQRQRLQALGVDLTGFDDEQVMRSSLYPMRSQTAGQKGSALRLGGGLLSGAGMPLLTNAMAK
jgi:hypothetical protein